MVLTGKGFGVTNLVILDEAGNPIIDEQVTVTRATASSVRIYRRSKCRPCRARLTARAAYKSDAERTSESEMSASQ